MKTKTNRISAPGPWRIKRIVERDSRYNADGMLDISFTHEITGEHARSYVDCSYNNHEHWEDIVKRYHQGEDILIGGELFYKTRSGKIMHHNQTDYPLIDADSEPTIIASTVNDKRTEDAKTRQENNRRRMRDLQELAPALGLHFDRRWRPEKRLEELNNSPDWQIQAEDDVETIRAKVYVKGLIQYARQLNEGDHQ